MRTKKLVTTLISLLTVVLMVFTLSATVFATDEVLPTDAPYEEIETFPEEPQVTEPEIETLEPTQAPEPDIEETEPEVEETQAQENEQPMEELPEVQPTDIVEPTKMAIPEVEVSDTSLIGGVIMWLCVAVGIAVIAGVLVSQRTRQIGTNSRDSRRR